MKFVAEIKAFYLRQKKNVEGFWKEHNVTWTHTQ